MMHNPRHTIRVMLVDDHPVTRAGLREWLEQEGDIVIVGECDNGLDALQLIQEIRPDVIVLDIRLPGLSGTEVARRLQSEGYTSRILMLSAYDDVQTIKEVLALGIAGYLTKGEAPTRIIESIRGVAQHKRGWISRQIGEHLLDHQHIDPSLVRREPAKFPQQEPLSIRELQVLRELALGHDNQQIAQTLSMAEGTVKNHITTIYGRIGVRTRAEAVAWAWSHKLITNMHD